MQTNSLAHTILAIDPLIMITAAILSILLLAAAIWLSMPWISAILGQQRLAGQLKQFEKSGSAVLNSVALPDKRGETTHINHLVITNQSITVIERAGYSGNIYGSLRDALWVQETKKGQHRFPNPVRNHETIRKTLQAILGTKMRIRTVTVFTAGTLHIPDSEYVMPSKNFLKFSEQISQEKPAGPKQIWASNLLRNVTIQDTEAEASTLLAANEMQGNPLHLKMAGYLLAASALTMFGAILLAGGRAAASLGII